MSSGIKNSAMRAGRGLAKARNQGATYAAGGMIPMAQAAVAAPKVPAKGKALAMPAKAKGKKFF